MMLKMTMPSQLQAKKTHGEGAVVPDGDPDEDLQDGPREEDLQDGPREEGRPLDEDGPPDEGNL